MVWRNQFLIVSTIVGIIFGVSNAFAQEYFGKNKVNYSNYDWFYIESEHFTIYFNKGALAAAEFVAKESERSIGHIEKALKYTLKGRYPIVIYNSHNGFSVSNIQLNELSEFTGGYTEFSQGRVVIPFGGSYADFRHVIHHELVHAVTIELWTGGGWMDSLVSQRSTLPPLWVAEGLAEYLSQFGWDSEADNFMRDATITGYVPTVEMLSSSYFAYKGGQSIFYMFQQDFGRDKVAEFISSFKTAKTVDKALKSSLGFGSKELNEKWQRWLKRQYWNEINLHNDPEEVAKNLTNLVEEQRGSYNVGPTISPQGDKIVYLTSKAGTFDIRLISAIDGKDLGRLVEGEKSSDYESMFVMRPGFSWSPDGSQIAFAAKSNNKNTLYTLDWRNKKIKKRFKFDLDGLFEPTWSPDGKQIAVAGIKDGWSDIYVVDLKDDSLHRITQDPYDEKHLDWSPNGEWIAISSDRPDTNLNFDGRKDFEFGQYDIFIIRPDGSEIRRVVDGEEGDIHPSWGPDSRQIAFVSDRTGVGNVYISHLDSSGMVYPVTNLLSSAQSLDWSLDGKKIAFSAFNKGGQDIFVMKNPLTKRKRMGDLPLTRFAKRLEGVDDKTFVEQQREKNRMRRQLELDMEPIVLVSEGVDSKDQIDKEDQKIETWISDKMRIVETEGKSVEIHNGDTRHEDSSQENKKLKDKSIPDWEGRTFKINKYKAKFKPELFAANAGFDTFYGVSSFFTLSLSDVMGDHRVSLLTSLNFSLKDSDFMLSYAFLKRQTNYLGQLFHTRLFFFDGGVLHADRYYGGAVALDRPFNRFRRVELGTRFVTVDRERLNSFTNPEVRAGIFGGTTRGQTGIRISIQRSVISEIALVEDTTLSGLYGPLDGRRSRLAFEGSGVGMRYATLQADFRNYERMLNEYTFAFRLSGGTSFGVNRTVFFLGGVNNPVNPTFSTIADVDNDRIFFSNYVWPLRGSELLEMAGDSFLLANVAFRFPLIRQLAMGWPLPFLFQDVQGELFLDVGSAFDRNEFDPWEYRDGGFELRDLKAGYGLGIRVNMGIFLFRYDLAWPTDFAQSFRPKQYFSIDFTGVF